MYVSEIQLKSFSLQRLLVDMKQCSQVCITQREKEAQELQQAILCLTVSAKNKFSHHTVWLGGRASHILHCLLSLRLTLNPVAPQRSARSVVEESDALFTQLIRWIELKRFEVRELIKVQEKTAISQAELLLEKIQKEIAEFKMNEEELDKLSLIEDHISFLQVTLSSVTFACLSQRPLNLHTDRSHRLGLSPQSSQSVQAPPELSTLPPVAADPSLCFAPVLTAVSDLKGLLQEVCEEGFVCMYKRGSCQP